MNNYEFRLNPAYCLFNGVAISEQKGSLIQFLLEHPGDDVLKERLKRSFAAYLENVKKISGNGDLFSSEPIVRFFKGTRNQIRKYVATLYENDEGKSEIKNAKKNTSNDEAAAVLLLDRILIDGRNKKATDIHIENRIVRFRINGILEYQMKISDKRYKELIQRIKLLGGLNVLEKSKSQDGHFVYGNKNPLFVRVSTVSIIDEEYGNEESVVMRLLDPARIPLSLDYLGFNENQLKRIYEFEELKNGLVIVCGPTGSGKSTTIASIIVEMQKKTNGHLKIISLEDPPEYYIPGISQIKIENESNGFEKSLDHIFRLDPDVIMIGEIRDKQSACAALKAALTGHLVFATLHAGGVSEAVLRMENLGLERKMLCSVLRGVVCQELNYLGSEIKLYGDIGIPIKGFSMKIKEEMGEEELEKYFIHETNYSELFSKTLELFNRRENEIEKKDRKSQRLWKGNKKNGKIYKRTV